jgi:hypothetical protein
MPSANSSLNTNASRRATIGLFGGAFAAGFLASGPSPDSTLIATCNELIEVQRKIQELGRRCDTPADEEKAEPAMTALCEHQWALENRLSDEIPPASTPEGARAMARVAFTRWHQVDAAGNRYADSFDQWLSLSVVELVGGAS